MSFSETSHRDPVSAMARSAAIEIIPLKSAEEKLLLAPHDTKITITCSPKFGIARTMELSAYAVKHGYQVVPHLAARQVSGRQELQEIVCRLSDVGVSELFVIGGDATGEPGGYPDSTTLLDDLAELDHNLERIGVGCYPEGHPNITEEALLEALHRKQAHADYMVSQLCFEADTILGWLRRMRSDGVELPLRIGLAAPLSMRKLIELSVKIGVGSSVRFLSKQHGLVGNLLLGGAYKPEELMEAFGEELQSPELGIEGVHLFSFNQVQAAVDWQKRIVQRP
ncbi:methylenetetrahydrofolate reductase [Streptomyces sp. NPDC007148]|uniref:methylenetetrahydrofolate reductase n=1 Tax=Streptomyces sp. NPDC007148 TaxID=3364775 RepID=UPI0036C9F145